MPPGGTEGDQRHEIGLERINSQILKITLFQIGLFMTTCVLYKA